MVFFHDYENNLCNFLLNIQTFLLTNKNVINVNRKKRKKLKNKIGINLKCIQKRKKDIKYFENDVISRKR